jgi:hypothetical protein
MQLPAQRKKDHVNNNFFANEVNITSNPLFALCLLELSAIVAIGKETRARFGLGNRRCSGRNKIGRSVGTSEDTGIGGIHASVNRANGEG